MARPGDAGSGAVADTFPSISNRQASAWFVSAPRADITSSPCARRTRSQNSKIYFTYSRKPFSSHRALSFIYACSLETGDPLMATPAQTLANQQNSQHATGPRTPEGKHQSSLNSLRHGLTGQTVVLPGEDTEAYATFRAKVFPRFRAPRLARRDPRSDHLRHAMAPRTRPQHGNHPHHSRPATRKFPRTSRRSKTKPFATASLPPTATTSAKNKSVTCNSRKRACNARSSNPLKISASSKTYAEPSNTPNSPKPSKPEKPARDADLPFDAAQLGFVFTDDQLDREEIRRTIKRSSASALFS